nr:MAG TPA: hypothetical protein [Caudoviricetes sp.]
MISTYKESQALADLLTQYLPDAFVTLDADQVTPHLLDGTPCVFIPPPKLTETSVPAYVLRYQVAVIGAPVAAQARARKSRRQDPHHPGQPRPGRRR